MEMRLAAYPSTAVKITSKDTLPLTRRKTASNPALLLPVGPMDHFFKALAALEKSKKGKVKIGYWGDSMIEGDIITGEFRSILQARFGGHGVGFVPITSVASSFRTTVQHAFSENWIRHSLVDHLNTKHPLGIAGFVFNPQAGSWVTLQPAFNKDSLPENLVLYYGQTINEKTIEANKTILKLTGREAVNCCHLTAITCDQQQRTLSKIGFNGDSTWNVFGLSLETENGVFVDNHSFRGNSGLPLCLIQDEVLTGFQSLMDYRLLVFQYGINVADPRSTDFEWYTKAMVNNILKFKKAMPNADVLVIGLGDKAYWVNGEAVPDPSIAIISVAQERIAKQTGAAFWSMYKAMGGAGKIVNWAMDSVPALAAKDYSHLTYRGGQKVAHSLSQYLLSEYESYCKIHKELR